MTQWSLTQEAAGQFLLPLEGSRAFVLMLRGADGNWVLAWRHGHLPADLALQAATEFDPETAGTVSPAPEGGGWLARYNAAAPDIDLCLLADFEQIPPDLLHQKLEKLEECIGWILVSALRDLANDRQETQLADSLVTALLLEAAEAPSLEILAQQWISRLEKAFSPGAVMVARLGLAHAKLIALSGGGVISQAGRSREMIESFAVLMQDQRLARLFESALDAKEALPSGMIEAALPQMESLGLQSILALPVHVDDEISLVVLLMWQKEGAAAPVFGANLRDTLLRALSDALQIHTRAYPSLLRKLRNWVMGLMRTIFGKRAWKLKLLLSATAVVLLLLALIPSQSRPGFSALIETNERMIIAAPWDGYVQDAPYRIGDLVPAQTLVLQMNTAELDLQKVMLEAEQTRLDAEARLALARGDIASLRSLEAEAQQNRLKLDLLARQIAQGSVRVTKEAQVLGGEAYLREGARVRLGESLIEIGDPSNLTVSAFIDETWVSELEVGAQGEVVLAAWPDRVLPVVMEQITSDHAMSEGENRFRARLRLEDAGGLALLDGMRGRVRIEAGPSTLLADYTRGLRRWFASLLWRLG